MHCASRCQPCSTLRAGKGQRRAVCRELGCSAAAPVRPCSVLSISHVPSLSSPRGTRVLEIVHPWCFCPDLFHAARCQAQQLGEAGVMWLSWSSRCDVKEWGRLWFGAHTAYEEGGWCVGLLSLGKWAAEGWSGHTGKNPWNGH